MSARHALPPIVNASLEAANAHDTDAWLMTFSPGGAVNDWGRVFTGHDAMRDWSDTEFIGANVDLRVTELRKQDDSITLTAQVGGDGFNGLSHFEFTVQDERITLMRITA
ncbi:nuclear transport factor 2 family protein [Streptomyces sp. NBC_01336]|uniref:nuclear transport factor 2 family protein n=1 Tax=Streptomyces sp. NBC_01336 TaxID=2903829 RepID=UPI002E100276|nr:nuclear transport factor 2 family protein [Streptomyces sp. NBC_01336]